METKGFDGEVVLIGAKEEDEEDVTFFRSIPEFWSYLCSLEADRIYAFAHNGGRFDNLDVIDYLTRTSSAVKVHIIPIHSSVIARVWLKGGKVINLFDSYKIIPLPLRDFGKTFDLPVYKLAFDRFEELSAYEELDEKTRKELEEYLRYDVLTLQAGMEAFYRILNGILKELKIEDLMPEIRKKYTIASISFTVLTEYVKRKFGPVLENRLSKEAEEFVRRSYAGGRTEAFRVYAENVKVYDFNSMYPAVMHSGYYPVGRWIWCEDSPLILEEIRSSRSVFGGFVEAEVHCPPDLDPPLLWTKRDGHLLFPRGRFRGVFPLPELRRAYRLGYGIRPIKALLYPEQKRVFREYVHAVYTRRKMAKMEGNAGLSLVLKLLLNSSYGKFAQRREKVVLYPLDQAEDECVEVVGEFAVKRTVTYIDRRINPAVASYITAYARLKLYDALEKYREHLCYCDTDSIFLAGIEDIPTSKELGELSYEGTYERGYFAGAKLYLLISTEKDLKIKLASKGIPKKLIKSLEPEELEDLYVDLINEKVREFEIERLAGFREIQRRKLARENAPRYRVLLKQTKKLRNTLREKREVDGNETRPKKVLEE